MSVRCFIKLEKNLFKAIFHHLFLFSLGIMTKKKVCFSSADIYDTDSFHFKKKKALEP